MTASELRTAAWLLRGISSLPGELRLSSGTLSFIACGSGSAWPGQLRKLAALLGTEPLGAAFDAGTFVELFSWPVADISVFQPWYYFGGGMKVRRDDIVLRVSFGRQVGARGGPDQGGADLRQLATMRARGRLWASALAEAIG